MKWSGKINIQSENQFRLFIHSSLERVNMKVKEKTHIMVMWIWWKLISQLESCLTMAGRAGRAYRKINFMHIMQSLWCLITAPAESEFPSLSDIQMKGKLQPVIISAPPCPRFFLPQSSNTFHQKLSNMKKWEYLEYQHDAYWLKSSFL